MSGWCSGSVAMAATCAVTASRISAFRGGRTGAGRGDRRSTLTPVNLASRCCPSWVATWRSGNRSRRRRGGASCRRWTQVATAGMLRSVSGPRRRPLDVVVCPVCGRRVAEVGARLAPAGGWRMELEFDIGSVPSASPMSRSARFPDHQIGRRRRRRSPSWMACYGAGEESS
jgi:hypothetical protein